MLGCEPRNIDWLRASLQLHLPLKRHICGGWLGYAAQELGYVNPASEWYNFEPHRECFKPLMKTS